jgi:hypothetical protein
MRHPFCDRSSSRSYDPTLIHLPGFGATPILAFYKMFSNGMEKKRERKQKTRECEEPK